jgi:DNA-directed RNA polymerase subunit M/transcription elongation factor TFIIS
MGGTGGSAAASSPFNAQRDRIADRFLPILEAERRRLVAEHEARAAQMAKRQEDMRREVERMRAARRQQQHASDDDGADDDDTFSAATASTLFEEMDAAETAAAMGIFSPLAQSPASLPEHISISSSAAPVFGYAPPTEASAAAGASSIPTLATDDPLGLNAGAPNPMAAQQDPLPPTVEATRDLSRSIAEGIFRIPGPMSATIECARQLCGCLGAPDAAHVRRALLHGRLPVARFVRFTATDFLSAEQVARQNAERVERLLERDQTYMMRLQTMPCPFYRCRFCKTNELVMEQKQTSRGDEGSTIYVYCPKCRKGFKTRA